MSATLRWLVMALALAVAAAAAPASSAENPRGSEVRVFWRIGCPYCEEARRYLDRLEGELPGLRVEHLEISESDAAMALFLAACAALAVDQPAVPLVVVGDRAFVGYLDDATTGAAIRHAVLDCRAQGCPDVVAGLAAAPPAGAAKSKAVQPPALPGVIALPIVGEIATGAMTLPMLTLVLGAVDGFNPCAMWVLVFLIGLLVGMENHRRMWILGGAFLLASAAVYFVFMAAWLNLLLLLGALLWIRIAVGLFALASGVYHLRAFVRGGKEACAVAPPEQRRRIIVGLRNAVRQQSFPLALAGIVVLAAAVNLVELLCSAGVPAIYTQVLALSDLPRWQHYLYLLLYVGVFLLDDIAVFATSILTLQAAGLTAKYSRLSHLIGGVVLGAIGLLLLLRPQWLTFG